jgi:putative aldouronate transport system permease protein
MSSISHQHTVKTRRLNRFLPLYLMAGPGLLYLLVNNYLPMAGLVIAFKDLDFSKGIFGSDWVGFSNFKYLFSTADAWVITRNTILFNLSFIFINTTVGLVLAITLSEIRSKISLKVYQAMVLLPMLISMVIVSYLVMALLNSDLGLMNRSILPALGLQPVQWYSEPKAWMAIIPIVNLWKGVGFGVIIYLSSIVGIDRELYEAATIDGAGFFTQIRTITLPLLTPVIIMTTTLAIGRIFRSDFGLFYQVTLDSGALYNTTNVIDTYVYRGLMQLGDIAMSSAAGLYQSVVGLILVLASNAIVRRISHENAMF